MKRVKVEGVLMNSREFICCGKSFFLTDEEIDKYVEVIEEVK